ncbi:MAG: bifunctional pyr operon transcriptional regulator/uracil phosphoribosyltransferase PyrR [Planctomycetota bacterium]|jgi:pyrimidine operon attenuation protein/uracil phosphoribosyltransferase
MKELLNSERIGEILDDIATEIVQQAGKGCDIAVIGIRSRGEIVGQRLAERLSKNLTKEVPCGVLDITLYRDDLNSLQGHEQPEVRTTEIGFSIDDKLIILVDDVLYTGRSTRAALDALMDLGRPEAIRLAVLVDRAGREYPIQADFVGIKSDIKPGRRVQVNLVESDGKDVVIVE